MQIANFKMQNGRQEETLNRQVAKDAKKYNFSPRRHGGHGGEKSHCKMQIANFKMQNGRKKQRPRGGTGKNACATKTGCGREGRNTPRYCALRAAGRRLESALLQLRWAESRFFQPIIKVVILSVSEESFKS